MKNTVSKNLLKVILFIVDILIITYFWPIVMTLFINGADPVVVNYSETAAVIIIAVISICLQYVMFREEVESILSDIADMFLCVFQLFKEVFDELENV